VRTAACSIAFLMSSAVASGAPPREGVLVPGRSLGGLALGATSAQVKAAWGQKFGRCRNCAETTWYFNLRPFKPEGAGVEFRAGRVAAIFTLWRPQGWRTSRGVAVGENAARITAVYGPLPRTDCGLYSALTLRRGRTVTVFYVLGEQVWGFALSRKGVPLCR
jgi:hypothetical protein